MLTVQPVLTGGNGTTTDLSVFLSEDEGSLLLFLGLALLERIPNCSEHLMYKMLLGRLVNNGVALRQLERTFGHEHRTLRNWAAALKSGDLDVMGRAFSGQGAPAKVTPEVVAFVRGMYEALRDRVRDYRRRIIEAVDRTFGLRLSHTTVSRLINSTGEEQEHDPAQEENADEPSCGENTCRNTEETSISMAMSVNHSPAPAAQYSPPAESSFSGSCEAPPAAVGGAAGPDEPPAVVGKLLPVGGVRAPKAPVLVHHLGQVLFSPWLDAVGKDRPAAWAIHEQWLGQILQGAVNIEQSKTLCMESLAYLTGPVKRARRTQRRLLREQADRRTASWVLQAGGRLLARGPGRGRVFYFDVHGKEYTGFGDILKGWCGRRHGVGKMLYMDVVHTVDGEPCFVSHADNYYDLRERFFLVLAEFDEVRAPQQQGCTWVIDRGIYGLDTFNAFFARGHSLITWEKDYKGEAWNDSLRSETFALMRDRNRTGDTLTWHLTLQEQTWNRDSRMRRIIVRVRTPDGLCGEVSVLCSDSEMSARRAVELIFSRWMQENDFWYLDTHFGLSQLTSYARQNYAEIADGLADRPMECPQYRDLKQRHTQAVATLKSALLKREQAADRVAELEAELRRLNDRRHRMIDRLQADPHAPCEAPPCERAEPDIGTIELLKRLRVRNRQLQQWQRKLTKRNDQAEQAKCTACRLRDEMDETLRYDSRLKLLITNKYEKLDTRAKAVMDALRITARNVFYALLGEFRPLYDNYRDNHVLLRTVTRSSGIIWTDHDGTVQIRLWLRATFPRATVQIIAQFLRHMTMRINEHFGNGRIAPLNIALYDPEELPI